MILIFFFSSCAVDKNGRWECELCGGFSSCRKLEEHKYGLILMMMIHFFQFCVWQICSNYLCLPFFIIFISLSWEWQDNISDFLSFVFVKYDYDYYKSNHIYATSNGLSCKFLLQLNLAFFFKNTNLALFWSFGSRRIDIQVLDIRMVRFCWVKQERKENGKR